MPLPNPAKPLSAWERAGLFFLALIPIVFGVLVEVRGAFLHTRRTDLAVFARAAWAIRAGVDVYSVTDEKGLHYHYPPLFAILMTPLADPPPGVKQDYAVPFAITVGFWYLFSVLVGFQSIHLLANALAESSESLAKFIGPTWSRAWWALRILPLLACLPYLGHALVIGQVNVLWMALTCWMAAAVLRGQRLQAGVWLAAAICLKVIPAFLLLYPIWRRDLRCLKGVTLGLTLGLVVLPVLILGSDGAQQTAQRWADVMLLPALGKGADHSRDQELLGTWSTHNQAFALIIHKTINISANPRPEQVTPAVQYSGISLGLFLTCLTLFAAGTKPPQNRVNEALFLGALCINMLSLSPGGHPHYLLLNVPLLMGLMASEWEKGRPTLLTPTLWIFLMAAPVASAIPLIVQNSGICYDLGLPMYAALLFWGAACLRMWQDRTAVSASEPPIPTMTEQQARSAAA